MRGHEEHEKENGERWLLTYADLITLLLAFFVIMFAMSNLDKEKYQAVIESLGNVFGVAGTAQPGSGAGGEINFPIFTPNTSQLPSPLPVGKPSASAQSAGQSSSPTPPGMTPLVTATPDAGGIGNSIEVEKMENVQRQVQGLLDKEHLSNDVTVTLRQRGLVISINSRVLFASGKADLNASSKNLVLRIAEVLVPLAGNQILVEGHTDTDPISTAQFRSNWELSSARACMVLRLLLTNHKLKEENMAAVGYGEKRPVAPNDTVANKAKNRRVNIVILKDEYNKGIDIKTTDGK